MRPATVSATGHISLFTCSSRGTEARVLPSVYPTVEKTMYGPAPTHPALALGRSERVGDRAGEGHRPYADPVVHGQLARRVGAGLLARQHGDAHGDGERRGLVDVGGAQHGLAAVLAQHRRHRRVDRRGARRLGGDAHPARVLLGAPSPRYGSSSGKTMPAGQARHRRATSSATYRARSASVSGLAWFSWISPTDPSSTFTAATARTTPMIVR